MRYNRLYKDNNYLTTTTNTQELSEYIENLKFEDLPADVVERAKMIMLQTIGAALAAKNTDTAAKVMKMAKEANGGEGGTTTVWGTGTKMAAVNAALVLGTLADTLSWADCAWTGHAAAGIIPCAWLAAEEKNKSGKDLIAAVAAAYEVYQRIAMAVQPSKERWNEKGWGMTSWQIFASILPIAKLYGMDARKINQAIGMGCECSTLPTNYYVTTMSDYGHFEHGYRARDGFLVAKSVDRGIHNQRDALDESRCYTGVICGNDGQNGSGETLVRSDETDQSWFTKELGSRYLIMETLLKPWPTDMWAQTPVELVHNLQAQYGFKADDVEEIIVDAPVKDRMWTEGFTSTVHAQLSIPYAIAAMLSGKAGADWYLAETMQDANVLALAKRVKGGASEATTVTDGFKMFSKGEFPETKVTVVLKDQTTYEAAMGCPVGHPNNMPTCEQFADRFRAQAAGVLENEKIEKAIETICNIENIENIAALADLLN